MGWFNNMRLRSKLFSAFGLLCAILIGVGFLGISTASGIKEDVDNVSKNILPSTTALAATRANLTRAQRDIRTAVLVDNPAEIASALEAFRKDLTDCEAAFNRYVALPMGDDEKKLANEFTSAFRTWREVNEQAATEAAKNTEAGNKAAVELITKKGAPTAVVLNATLTQLFDMQEKSAATAASDTEAEFDFALKELLAALGIGLLLAAATAVYLTRSVLNALKPVTATMNSLSDKCATWLADALRSVAEGDLSVTVTPVTPLIEGYGKDELGELAETTNSLRNRIVACIGAYEESRAGLNTIVTEVRSTADDLADTSQQLGAASSQTSAAVQQVTMAVQSVAAGAQETSSAAQNSSEAIEQLAQVVENVAQGAQDQARQIQVASDTTTKMAANIQQVAGDAQAVASASIQTKASAENGATAVRETVTGMQEIKLVVTDAATKVEELGRLGERIGAVVETIDDIAEQTNLLALNAAIEAARAGEHGRGFAVVADEVRKLAERSQRETKAIGELIVQVQAGTKDAVRAMESGSSKVEQGALKADQAGEALSEILTAVEATVRQVGGIASAAQEMSAGAQSVVDTMHSLSAVVEESSAATEEMAAQAGQVTGSIQSIAAVSEENSAATEEVSASAEEMTAQVEEMTAQADQLANTAEQLRELVARFRLEAGGESQGGPVARRRSSDWQGGQSVIAGRRAS